MNQPSKKYQPRQKRKPNETKTNKTLLEDAIAIMRQSGGGEVRVNLDGSFTL